MQFDAKRQPARDLNLQEEVAGQRPSSCSREAIGLSPREPDLIESVSVNWLQNQPL